MRYSRSIEREGREFAGRPPGASIQAFILQDQARLDSGRSPHRAAGNREWGSPSAACRHRRMPQRPAANDAISRGFREDERDDQRRERHLARGILVEVRGLRGAKKSNRETARYKKLLGCLRRLSLPGKL